MTESFQVPIDLRGFEVEIGVSKSVQDFRILQALKAFKLPGKLPEMLIILGDFRCTSELFEPKAPLTFGGSKNIC